MKWVKTYVSVSSSTLHNFKITLTIFLIHFSLDFNYLNIIAISLNSHNTFILDIWVSNATNGYRDIHGSSKSQMHWNYFKWHLELYPNVTTFDVCEPNLAPLLKKHKKGYKLIDVVVGTQYLLIVNKKDTRAKLMVFILVYLLMILIHGMCFKVSKKPDSVISYMLLYC